MRKFVKPKVPEYRKIPRNFSESRVISYTTVQYMEYTEYKKKHTGFRISGMPKTPYLDGQHDTLGGPVDSHTSQLDLIAVFKAYNKAVFFVQLHIL
jgi:hypothetical protein